MDILERYLSGYVVECLTGIGGKNQNYYHIISVKRSNTRHPMLKKVLGMVHGKDPQDPDLKAKVRQLVLKYIATE